MGYKGTYLISLVDGSHEGDGTAPVIERPFQFINVLTSFGRLHNDRGQLDLFRVLEAGKRFLEYRDRSPLISQMVNLCRTVTEIDSADISFAQLDQLLSSENPIERYNITNQALQTQLCLLQRLTNGGQRPAFDKTDTRMLFVNPFCSALLKTFLEESLASFEKVPGVDFEDLAGSYDALGSILFLMNDYSGAEESFQQGIRLREMNNGDPAEIISSLTMIGKIHFKMNNDMESERAFQSALSLKKSLGVYDHVDTANIYATLRNCHLLHGNSTKALEAQQEALQLRKKHLGERSLTAASFNQVGLVLFQMEVYESAKEAFHKARHMSRKLPGQEKISALYCYNVAHTYFGLGSK